jgi:hypothetical protein
MTGRGDLTLGLLVGALGAMLIPMILGNEAIYESLRRRMLRPEATREQTTLRNIGFPSRETLPPEPLTFQ